MTNKLVPAAELKLAIKGDWRKTKVAQFNAHLCLINYGWELLEYV
jgi:hypothetical protein